MPFTVDCTTVLGDPHLGRKFINDVALHRRGEREALQWKMFEESLNDVKNKRYHICMGDLFDSAFVSNETIFRAAKIYISTASKNPGIKYFILMGNHDGSKDTKIVTSFDVFEMIVSSVDNIVVIREQAMLYDGMLMCPWHPIKTSEGILEGVDKDHVDVTYGHWDLQSYGGDVPHNILPYQWFLDGEPVTVYNGHIHTPGTQEINGLTVNLTGSMMPLAFGEGRDMHVMLTLDELASIDRKTLYNKVVRIVLKHDEIFDEQIDCYGFSIKRLPPPDTQSSTVIMEEFDLFNLFEQSFIEKELSEKIIEEKWLQYEELKNVD